MGYNDQELDALFVNPRDLVGASPYVKLATIAAVIRENNLKCRIIEPAAESISNKRIAQLAKICSCKIICISVFPSTLPDAYQLIKEIRTINNSATIVIEGYMVNADVKVVKELNANYGLRGDIEYSFLELIKKLLNNDTIDTSIAGIVINRDDILEFSTPAYIPDLNVLPIPAFDLLPIDQYYSASTSSKYIMMFTSRGCPYACNFCASPAQMKYRYLSVEKVLEQLQYLVYQLKIEWIEFMDLTFTIDRKRIYSICEGIISSGLHFKWGCETRVDRIDKNLLIIMKKAGCEKITFGIESGSEKIRTNSGKKISNTEMRKAITLCKELGIKTMANFIFGHPGETKDDMEETISLSKDLPFYNALFTKMIPLPDVEIFKIALERRQITNDVWYRYMRSEIALPVFTPQGISIKELNRMYVKAYLKFYLSKRVLKSYLPLFSDFKFLTKTLQVFLSLTFGKTKFK